MQYKKPLVSIITPSLNQGQYIEETIKSVLNQSYSNIEYIIIDGGSTDATADIVAKYRTDPRLRWVSEPDAGQYDAVNKGFLRAHGDIYGWINADDWYLPYTIQKVVELFVNDTSVDIIYGKLRGLLANDGHERDLYCRDFSLKWLMRYCYTNPSASFIRAEIIRKSKFMLDLSIPTYGDWDWYLRMAKAGKKFRYMQDILATFRVHPTSRIMAMTKEQKKNERILLALRHNLTPTYIRCWSDYIIPWYERVINLKRLIEQHRWTELRKRILSAYRYVRNGVMEH